MPRKKRTSPTLTIRITAEQHARAVASASGGCLIADAIREQYPHLTGITVDMATIRVTDRKEGLRYTYLTPPQAQHCLLSFDQGWPDATETIVLKRAVKITMITRAKTGGSSVAEVAERRAAHMAELEARVAEGGTLSRYERASLTRMQNAKPAAERPSSHGPVVVVGEHRDTTVKGGKPLKQGKAHPNLLRGRDRHFGAKLADPGSAFSDAVEAAVAERLKQAQPA